MNILKYATFVLTIALCGLFLFAKSVPQADDPGIRLRAAIEKEEVEGNLQAAIEQYKKIVSENGDHRAVAAKALLRLAGCFEKLGREEARKTYQQLLNDYPEQQQEVAAARQRLAMLRKRENAGIEPAFAIRQVWTDAKLSMAPSPDGRYVSFLDGNTGNLAIRDLEKQKNRPLTKEGSWGMPTQFVLFSQWSPDGTQIAYDWYGANNCVELRLVSREGGMPRILANCEDESTVNTWMKTYDWSPDGKQILQFRAESLLGEEEGILQVVLVSAADGTIKVLKTIRTQQDPAARGVPSDSKDWPKTMRFSRDGRYIVYDRPQEKKAPEHDIFLISVDGKREIPLVQHPAHDVLFGWPPDRKGIIYASDRTGSRDLYFLPVSEGKAQDAAQVVKRSIGQIEPMGFTQSGSFFYMQATGLMDIYIATMDLESGKVLSPPEKGIKHFEGSNSWPSYSPDGKYLAYVRRRTPYSDIVCLQSLETGEVRIFGSKWTRIEGPNWSPDSRFIYFSAADDEGKAAGRLDIQSGEFSHVFTKPADRKMYGPEVIPDGKGLLYYRQSDRKDGWEIIRQDLASGDIKHIFTIPFPRGIAVNISPDGQRLAIMSRIGVLKVMPFGGGEPQELLRVKQFNTSAFPFIQWTADGKYILFCSGIFVDNTLRTSLWRIPADGGEPEDLNLRMQYIGAISAHPSGKHIAFVSPGFTARSPSVWVMENILPSAASASK